MEYAIVKNQELIKYPYSFSQLQEENPYTDYGQNTDVFFWFPQTETAIQNGYSIVEVLDEPLPTYDVTQQKCTKNSLPIFENAAWTLGWTVSNLTVEEQETIIANKKAANKATAEGKLQATDWSQVADVPLLNKQEFTDYRAIVRAIAINPPVDAVFPDVPTSQWA